MSALVRPPNADILIRPGTGSPAGARSSVSQDQKRTADGRRKSDRRERWGDSDALLAQEVAGRSAADAALVRVNRMVAVFGHDLRVLFNALTINAELCSRQQGDEARESARNLQLTVGRMDQLLSSLLDYARLKSNKLNIEPETLDAADVLREAVEIFRPLARAKSLSLTLDIAESPIRAAVDRVRILQVISNLLSNAIKFSAANGRIVVRAETAAPQLLVTVTDEGLGIPEGDLERVFECFTQLPGSSAQGLGLGLYISRAIIESHGGRIWATSRPGAGSTLSFTIPGAGSAPLSRKRRLPSRQSLLSPPLRPRGGSASGS